MDLQEIFNRLTNARRLIEKYGIRAFEFYFLLDEGKRFFDLACEETDWTYWSNCEAF